MRFSKHGDARDASIGSKVMHVDVQERGTCDFDAFSEGILDVLEVVETTPVLYIDNQMRTGESHTVTRAKVVLTIVLLRHARAADGMLFFRLGGA
jgi:hypothetical protein